MSKIWWVSWKSYMVVVRRLSNLHWSSDDAGAALEYLLHMWLMAYQSLQHMHVSNYDHEVNTCATTWFSSWQMVILVYVLNQESSTNYVRRWISSDKAGKRRRQRTEGQFSGRLALLRPDCGDLTVAGQAGTCSGPRTTLVGVRPRCRRGIPLARRR